MAAAAPDSSWHRRRCKSGRYVDEVTAGDLQALFHLPAEQAAQHIHVSVTVFKKLARKHGIARWPYRSIKAHATAALCKVASGSGTAGGSALAASPAQPPALSHPGTPASSPLVAHSTAQAGSANRALFFVPAGAAIDPAFAPAGSGSSSMQVLMLPGGGSGRAVLVPGSDAYGAVGCGAHPAQQRSYTPFVAPAGGSAACGSQQFVPHATCFAAPATNNGPQRSSGDFSPSASTASLKTLLKRAAALTGEENMLQALLEEIHLRRQQLAGSPAAADSAALGCLQAAVVSKLAQTEARAAAAELWCTPAWGSQGQQLAAQSPQQSAQSVTLSLIPPKLPRSQNHKALSCPPAVRGAAPPMRLGPMAARIDLAAAKAALPRSPFESGFLPPAPLNPLVLDGGSPPAAVPPPAQPFVPLRPSTTRALTPATLQLVHEPRVQQALPPSLAAARLAMLQMRFAGGAAGAQYWRAPPA